MNCRSVRMKPLWKNLPIELAMHVLSFKQLPKESFLSTEDMEIVKWYAMFILKDKVTRNGCLMILIGIMILFLLFSL